MNAQRRKSIQQVIDILYKAQDIISEANWEIDSIKDEEQEAYDNLPENLQYSEKGEKMEEAIDNLDNAHENNLEDDIQDIIDYLESAME